MGDVRPNPPPQAESDPGRAARRAGILVPLGLVLAVGWLALSRAIFPQSAHWSQALTLRLGGLILPGGVIAALGATVLALAALLIFRLAGLPRFTGVPRGGQGVAEAFVAAMSTLGHAAGRQRQKRRDRRERRGARPPKKPSPVKRAVLLGAVVCLCVGFALALLFPHSEHEPLSVALGAPPVRVLGLGVPSSVVYTWGIMAVLLAAALVIRLAVIPRFSTRPGALQNALETAVEAAESFTLSHVHGLGEALSPYIFTVAVYIVCCAMTELLGLRPPTTDITVTFALSIITFIMINYYGIKRNGVKGRAGQFIRPKPFMVPFKLLSDVAVPISLACRLFGNMLGGMIVMNLLYMALGHFSVGVPAVLGLYFNLFHPLIQTFIFIKLSLSFIEEAVEG